MAGASSLPQHVAGEETGLAARRRGGSTALSIPRPCQAKGEALCSQLQAVLCQLPPCLPWLCLGAFSF